MNDHYFINDRVVVISALCGICLSSGLIFKTIFETIHFFELNTPLVKLIYFAGILCGIICAKLILKNKNIKIPQIFYITRGLSYFYAIAFFVYSMAINIIINMIPMALLPDICYRYYGEYYKAKDYYYIMYVLSFMASFSQSAAIAYIILEKIRLMKNKIF